jgi:hypothetical protein
VRELFLKKNKKNGETAAKNSPTSQVDINRELKRIAEARSWARTLPISTSNVVADASNLPDKLKDIRIAAILDPFSESCLNGVCNIKNLSIDAWEYEIEEFRPHILLIESAWDGKGRGWRKKVSVASIELQDLINFCKTYKIPVVFWNKEDPVHYDAFINTARL